MLARKLLMAGGAAAPFHPTDIAGCLIALRWDFGVLNAAGSPAADAEKVATWQDQSGNNRHYTQSSDTTRPIFRSIGNVDFSANANINMLASGTWALTNNCTVVTKQVYDDSQGVYGYALPVGSNAILIFWNDGNTAGIYATPNDVDAYGAGLVTDEPHIFSYRKSTVEGQTIKTQMDNGAELSQTSGLMDFTSAKIDRINTFSGSNGARNHVYSLVAYNSVLSDTDLARVKAWCNA